MADLSLKKLDDGLMRAVKMAAITAGVSQRAWVILVLKEATNAPRSQQGTGDGSGPIRERTGGAGGGRARRQGGQDKHQGEAPGSGESNNGAQVLPQVPVIDPARVLIPGEKCNLCQSPLYEFRNPTTASVKWKCTGKTPHTMTPREARRIP